jgi:FixJ family two-component response regulator
LIKRYRWQLAVLSLHKVMASSRWNVFDRPHTKVAVVSANIKNLRVLSLLLLNAGVLPIPYTNETEFLDENQSTSYDAIILDSTLTQSGVGEITKTLVSKANAPPVVVIVNKADISNVVLAIRAGASDVLCLPLSSQHLARRLRAAGLRL